jgi:DMSO/TMAO reductase YedYZ molybdopterin-dependent catalytic subunit
VRAQPSEEITRESHCVTNWSKLGTTWERVSVDTLLDSVKTVDGYVTAFCDDGGYTTNLPLSSTKKALRYTTLSEVLRHSYITQRAMLRNGVQAGEENLA